MPKAQYESLNSGLQMPLLIWTMISCAILHMASWRNSSRSWNHSASPEAIFSEGRAEFLGSDHDYDTHTGIAVSSEDDIELHRVRITSNAAPSAPVISGSSGTKTSLSVPPSKWIVLIPHC
jgi:hypothetical protein